MSNVFLQHYAWRAGTFVSSLNNADATLVGREIDALGKDTIKEDDLIDAGIGGQGELAKCFTQDRDEAAHKRWRDEATYVLRHLVPVIIDTKAEEEHAIDQRVWVPIYPETNRKEDVGVHRRVPIDVVPRPTEAKPDKQMQGWVALMAWVDKYGDDPLYTPIVAAIKALQG